MLSSRGGVVAKETGGLLLLLGLLTEKGARLSCRLSCRAEKSSSGLLCRRPEQARRLRLGGGITEQTPALLLGGIGIRGRSEKTASGLLLGVGVGGSEKASRGLLLVCRPE